MNEFILQSQFDRNNHFNGLEICKINYNYDALASVDDYTVLKEKVMEDNWSKRDIIKMIELINKKLRNLNHSVVQELEAIKRKISACNKSII